MDSGFQVLVPDFQSVELGFWIAIVSGIPDSLSCILDSNAQDSEVPQTKISRIPRSEFSYIGRVELYTGVRIKRISAKRWFHCTIKKYGDQCGENTIKE